MLGIQKKKPQNSPNKSKYINKDQNSKAKIRYNVSETMFNGKCVNQCCYRHIKFTLSFNICNATPKEMSDLDKIRNRPVDPKYLRISCSYIAL